MKVAPITGLSLGRHMLRGSAWMVAQRWSLRLTGLVSTAILARLLMPADFGVVAIAMLFVGLVEALADTGERLALLRHPDPGREHYDTAWTLQVMVGLAVAAAVFLLAPLTSLYFHDSRAIPVMRLLSLRALLGGLENIGTVDLRRQLQFHRLFQLTIRAKMISMAVTLSLALAWRNYWALASGIVAGQAAITILSYAMQPYRPRFSLASLNEIFGFSAWTMLRTTGLYFTSQVDQLAVGGVGSAAAMGRYSVASSVAASPIAEINEPVMAVLYPVMSRVGADRAAVKALFMRVLGWSAVISAAVGAGVAAIARDYTLTVLGNGWRDVAPLIPWLALSAALLGSSSGADATFDILGLPHRSARLQWLRLALLMVCIIPVAVLTRNIEAIAAARLAVSLAFVPVLLGSIGRTIGARGADYASAIWRPLLAACVMVAVLLLTAPHLPAASLPRLLFEVPLGGSCYVSTLLVLWNFSGRPDAPEKDVLSMLHSVHATAAGRI